MLGSLILISPCRPCIAVVLHCLFDVNGDLRIHPVITSPDSDELTRMAVLSYVVKSNRASDEVVSTACFVNRKVLAAASAVHSPCPCKQRL